MKIWPTILESMGKLYNHIRECIYTEPAEYTQWSEENLDNNSLHFWASEGSSSVSLFIVNISISVGLVCFHPLETKKYETFRLESQMDQQQLTQIQTGKKKYTSSSFFA